MICEKSIEAPLIEMPDFPLTEIYVDRKIEEKLGFVDQSFQFCSICGHGQIANVIDTELQYGDATTYHFRTSTSLTGRETTKYFIDFLRTFIGEERKRTIVEIGCNDLYLLKSLKNRAIKLIGIDPILKGIENEVDEDNISAIGDFVENVTLPPDIDVILCKDVLEHVSEPKAFLKKIISKASDDTLFVFQIPILETMLEDCRFDQVFHQHLNYFSLRSFMHLLNELGCSILGHTINYNHWGAALIAFQKNSRPNISNEDLWHITQQDIIERYNFFQREMEQTNKKIVHMQNNRIYGYGAALMLPVISYYLKNDFSCIDCIIDDDIEKDGLFYLNLPVQIKHISRIDDLKDAVLLLTAISSRINTKRILGKLFNMDLKRIIYPLKTI
jgi:hypothetical protein